MSAKKVCIETFSHGFAVDFKSYGAKEAVRELVLSMAQWGMVKKPPKWRLERVVLRTYTGKTTDGRRWFSIFALPDFMKLLRRHGVSEDEVEIVHRDIPKGVPVIFPRNDKKPPREYQIPIIEHFKKDNPYQVLDATRGIVAVTNLQTGKGKTLTALQAMTEIGERTLIQMKGGYIGRWLDDLEDLFKFKRKDILVIRGSDNLKALINMALCGELEAKVILMSTRTYYMYLKEYEVLGDDFSYGVPPHELYGILGIGLKIIDEIHEDFHLQARSNIYMNMVRMLGLSATLETDDPTLKKLYEYVIPKSTWYSGLDYDAYVGVIAHHFGSATPGEDVTTIRGSDNYSHTAYEQYLMAHPGRLKVYLDMIRDLVYEHYLQEDFAVGQKCLIFCSLTEFCDIVRDHLRKSIDMDIQTYIGETDESVLKTADIIATTVGSAGTAVDIAGLRTMILTRAINRREANEQIKGRGRRLADWPEVEPRLVYFVNRDIPKHVQYHQNKMEQYSGKVAYHDVYQSNYKV